jgi:(3R)-3-hydroxyacyl-CoA dehydrogenase / 3a,7a,12a-trihydroxy-5b-cholest-24-enoyl-CoA hydratase / enoyl-CoA hydratase 2
MPEDILNILKPEYVSPLVLYLCHEETEENGSLFEVGGGWIGKVRWQKSSGSLVKQPNRDMTPEDVRDKWNEITSFEKPLYHTTIGEATNHCIESCSSSNESTNEQVITEAPIPTATFSYDFKAAILYALSLGVSTANEKNLKFLYENHPEFSVLPSFGVIPAFGTLFSDIASLKLPYNLTIDPAKLLHGEQYLELFKPFSPNSTLNMKTKLIDVLDKGSGATLIINGKIFLNSLKI